MATVLNLLNGLGPLRPDPGQLTWGLLLFFATFGLLARGVLPRIARTLADRDDAIDGGMARAEAVRKEAARPASPRAEPAPSGRCL